ncbi:MAG: D-glycerate dehydrogenase [Balneolaceae bacterium]|nr:D-glycerate dehydrogenase [Balneolaceae bacterium]
MSKHILITEPIVEEVIEKLREQYEVTVGERGRYNDEKNLVQDIPGYHGLLSMLSNPVTGKVIKAGTDLQVIANHAVGYNNIDLEAANRSGIQVANTPDVLTESTADFAMALLLATARKLCEAQEYLRDGRFEGWEPLGFLGRELSGSTMGILGMGRIGTAVARRARGFNMDILYKNRSRASRETEQELGARYVDSVVKLARSSDVLSLNCPLTDETHHIIDAEILQQMKPTSLIINTARGAVIDEAALAAALHEEEIAGAGLDVFEEEPEVHPDLLTAPNCVITPHIASATHQTRTDIGMLAADAIIGVLEGKTANEIPNLLAL